MIDADRLALLDGEIAKEEADARHAETVGDTLRRDLSLARFDGLAYARTLIAGPQDGCAHPVHDPAGVDETGRQLWACRTCGHVA